MALGEELTKQVIGKRVKVGNGGSVVEGVVSGIAFMEHGTQLQFAPAVEPFTFHVMIKDDTEIHILDEAS